MKSPSCKIQLTESLENFLRLEAARRGLSLSSFCRFILTAYSHQESAANPPGDQSGSRGELVPD